MRYVSIKIPSSPIENVCVNFIESSQSELHLRHTSSEWMLATCDLDKSVHYKSDTIRSDSPVYPNNRRIARTVKNLCRWILSNTECHFVKKLPYNQTQMTCCIMFFNTFKFRFLWEWNSINQKRNHFPSTYMLLYLLIKIKIKLLLRTMAMERVALHNGRRILRIFVVTSHNKKLFLWRQ